MAMDYIKLSRILKILIIKGLGFGITIMDIFYTYGVIHLPNPAALNKPMEILIAFIVGLILMIVPINIIEKMLEKLISKKIDDLEK